MKSTNAIYSSLLAAALFSACGVKQPKAVEERNAWIDSLNDSIALYQKKTAEVQEKLASQRMEVGQLLQNFDYVNNPREVEGYYILKSWKARYPLNATGLTARVTEDERFELIATLSGKKFTSIAVSASSETLSTDVVPHDQALNYWDGSLDKVCFTGSKADSIGWLLSQNHDAKCTAAFLEGSPVSNFNIPKDEVEMVGRTWQLYTAQRECHALEKELPRLAGKVSACRRIIESRDSVN